MAHSLRLISSAIPRPAVAAILAALQASGLEATPVSATDLPTEVRRDVKNMDYWCRRFGGIPPKKQPFVRKVDLTGDGRPDYIVDLGLYDCRKHVSFMDGGHDGRPVRIFVSGPKHTAHLAYDGYSHGVKLTSTHGRSRIWLRVGALACGQPPGSKVFASWWFCLRPLQWNGRTKRFVFGPLSEIRDITRPN